MDEAPKSFVGRPIHDPTKVLTTEGNPFIYEHEDGNTFFWDFVKREWFTEAERGLIENEDALKDEELEEITGKKRPRTQAEKKEDKDNKKSDEKYVKTMTQIPSGPRTIVIENLPPETTAEQIAEFCNKCGIVKRDEYTGEYAITLHRDESKQFTGSARVTFLRPESLDLALLILPDSEFAPGFPVRVFEPVKDPNKKKKKKNNKSKQKSKTKKRKLYDQSKDLSWDEESRVHVVFRNVFDPIEGWKDINFFPEIEQDIRDGCESIGPIESIKVFENHPDGVVIVKFEEPIAAGRCIELMHDRWFGGRRLVVEYYDKVTNYDMEDPPEKIELQQKRWSQWIEGGSQDEITTPSTTTTPSLPPVDRVGKDDTKENP